MLKKFKINDVFSTLPRKLEETRSADKKMHRRNNSKECSESDSEMATSVSEARAQSDDGTGMSASKEHLEQEEPSQDNSKTRQQNPEESEKKDVKEVQEEDNDNGAGSGLSVSEDIISLSKLSSVSSELVHDKDKIDTATVSPDPKKISPKRSEEPGDSKTKSHKRDYETHLNYLFQDARFFLMKSDNAENVVLSKSRGVWSTPPTKQHKLIKTFKQASNVILIFSVKSSGKFSGFARLASGTPSDVEEVNWMVPSGVSRASLREIFHIDWISKHDLVFEETKHLFNPWNEGKPVKIGRDGQAIEPHVGKKLCRLFRKDSKTDWDSVMKRVRDTSKEVDRSKITRPVSPDLRGRMVRRPRSRERGEDRCNDLRNARTGGLPPRMNYNSHSQLPPPSNYYGRASRRPYPFEDEYAHRAKRHGVWESDRQNLDFYGERNAGTHGWQPQYGGWAGRDYYYRSPPPMPPFPYLPPPPFNSVPPPPPPRYYAEVRHSPEATRRSLSEDRPSRLHHKSVSTSPPRRNNARGDKDRKRDRERENDKKYRRK